MIFLSPLVVDQPVFWKPMWTWGPEQLTTRSCSPPHHPDTVEACKNLNSQEHPAPDSLEFSEIWDGESALLPRPQK